MTLAPPDRTTVGTWLTMNVFAPALIETTVVFQGKAPVPVVTVTIMPTTRLVTDVTVMVVPLDVAPAEDVYAAVLLPFVPRMLLTCPIPVPESILTCMPFHRWSGHVFDVSVNVAMPVPVIVVEATVCGGQIL